MERGHRIGKYQIESKLGEGGNGVVFEARDTVLGRRVALKALHPRFVHDADLLGRFRAEAEAMARLNHPNVVTVHDFVGDANTWAIVMELVEGGETLASVLARDGRLSVRRALPLLRHVARGLAHAHAKNIVHRDVKPANVLVVREGSVEHAKVTDFGIARLIDEERRTRGDMTLGTLYYIAPEQAQSSAVDQRADVYSFGVTMYETLTGSVPFDYASAGQILSAHLSEAPRPPSSRVPDLPPGVDRLVLDCLAKRPDDRPHDAAAVADRLDALIAELETAPATRPTDDIPRTRMIGSLELTPPSTELPQLRSFADPAGAAGKSDQTSIAIWVGIGVTLLVSAVCLFGGLLSCMTCAR